jgi:hypothetical protein
MNSYEEEIQKNIEAGRPSDDNDMDAKAYREVFRVLKTSSPETSLPINFADKIVARIIEKQKRESARDFFWFGAGIFFMVVALIVTIYYTGFKFDLGFLKGMSAYTGLFVFGIAFILLLNVLEKRIVPRKEMK